MHVCMCMYVCMYVYMYECLKDVFIANGYPMQLVEKTIKQSWKIEHPVTHPPEEETSQYYDCLDASYTQGFLERLWKDFKYLRLKLLFKTTKTLWSVN